MRIWIDGEAPDVAALAVPALMNYGHFTAMQVRDGAVRGLANHLRRVDAAHRELFGHGLDLELVRSRWALAARHQPDAYLRATFYETPDGQTHDLVAVRAPVDPSDVPQRLRSVTYVRPLAHLKHVGTFAQIYYGQEAERASFDDALLATGQGEAAETTIANIGFVVGGRVVWPTAPALHGIGQQLLEAALPAEHAPVRLADVPGFDGAFTVNSVGVVPVAQIDSHRFHEPGATVAAVIAAHAELPWDRLDRLQRRENHQDLVPGVVGGNPQLAGPAADFPPAEAGVEVFESHAAAGGEVKLLQAHLVAGDAAEAAHQGRSDAPVAVGRPGLQVVDGAPVGDERTGVAAEDDPPGESPADAGEQDPG